MSETDVNQVRARLQEHGRDCEVFLSQEDLENANERRRQREQNTTRYPTFEGADAILFIDVKTVDLLIVRGLLEKMGFKAGSHDVLEVPEASEYLCVRCNYQARAPGLCPKHSETLLSFSPWAEAKRRQTERRNKRFQIAVIIFLVALFAFLIRST